MKGRGEGEWEAYGERKCTYLIPYIRICASVRRLTAVGIKSPAPLKGSKRTNSELYAVEL